MMMNHRGERFFQAGGQPASKEAALGGGTRNGTPQRSASSPRSGQPPASSPRSGQRPASSPRSGQRPASSPRSGGFKVRENETVVETPKIYVSSNNFSASAKSEA